MTLNNKPYRRSIRLKDYDYSTVGMYFVTICTQNRTCLFGEVINNKVVLNEAGNFVEKCWEEIPLHFSNIILDDFVIMPNHVHGILSIAILQKEGNTSSSSSVYQGTSKTLGSVIRGFKIGVTKWHRRHLEIKEIWQRNYYEHIIRDEISLNQIRRYIAENPTHWQFDRENPATIVQKQSNA